MAVRRQDQFALELDHYTLCIQGDTEPHTGGLEGLQDQRIIEVMYEPAPSGRTGTDQSSGNTYSGDRLARRKLTLVNDVWPTFHTRWPFDKDLLYAYVFNPPSPAAHFSLLIATFLNAVTGACSPYPHLMTRSLRWANRIVPAAPLGRDSFQMPPKAGGTSLDGLGSSI